MNFAKNKISFLLYEMSFLRYFIPLILEANSRGIKAEMFIEKCNKYSCPLAVKNFSILKELSERLGFEIKHASQISTSPGVVFMIEGGGIHYLNDSHTKIVIPVMLDFLSLSDNYMDKIDKLIFPSKFIAEFYGLATDKTLYLGSPKFDVCDSFDREQICKKYGINLDEKIALVVAPRRRDLHKANLPKLYTFLNNMGYKIAVKTRGKDPMEQKYQGDYYFVDYSWFPHDTLELLYISDVMINFESSASAEAALMKTPVIDFHIKPKRTHLVSTGEIRDVRKYEFLMTEDFCSVLDPDISYEDFSKELIRLLSLDLEEKFSSIRKKFFFQPGSSARILDAIYGEHK